VIYLAIDHRDPVSGKPMPNGIPLEQHHLIKSQDGRRLDYPRIVYYLHQCGIPQQIVATADAPAGAWYPVVLGWFDFSQDYIAMISPAAHTRIQQQQMRLVFTYHEGDNPTQIRLRINQLCTDHAIDPEQVWLISGNTSADSVPGCVYWPELEFMYWRSVDRSAGAQFHERPRSRAFTGLCRIDKLWRKVFMSELWADNLHHRGYFSYTQHQLGSDDNFFNCALNNTYLARKQHQVNQFIKAGPFVVDDLNSAAHNNYAANMTDLYEDSYFNIVLETMIEIDNSGGQFITEKTFKPIFNNQFFVVVGSQNHLAHLRELGYQSFGRVIDEHYDSIENNQERFESVLKLTKDLSSKSLVELHDIYQQLQPEIQHNHQVFMAGMAHRLQAVVDRINRKS
jgi:cyclophilin family peptidyl-prolyl cis-trans isomerase